MAADTTSASDEGRVSIRVDAAEDVENWARKLDTTPEQIKDAVGAVGTCADDVEMHLKGTRSSSNADAAQRVEPGGGQAE